MIGKNEQLDDNDNSSMPIKLIAKKRKLLEENSCQVQAEIKNCFTQLVNALHIRERQLLRQAEAVHTQQLSLVQSSLEFLPPIIANLQEIHTLKEQIENFGRIELSGVNYITVKDIEPYKVADYQEAHKDHIIFDKSIKKETNLIIEGQEVKETEVLTNYGPVSNNTSPSADSTVQEESRDTFTQLKSPEISPSCSSLLLIKQKLNFSRLSPDKPRELEIKCSNNAKECIESTDISVLDDTSLHEINMHEWKGQISCTHETEASFKVDNFNARQQASEPVEILTKEFSKNQDMLVDSYKHPKQVQQWLQQILVETEIEPMVHELGQLSEISAARHYNDFQLKT